MGRSIINWFNNYPKIVLEPSKNFMKEIEFSKILKIKNKSLIAIDDYKNIIKKNILLNLDSTYIKYYFLEIKEKKISKKYIKNYILWNLQVKQINLSKYQHAFLTLSKGNYLILIYEKNLVESITNKYALDNVIVTPKFLGYYNYWKYINKKKACREKNLILIATGEYDTEILFIKNGILKYAQQLDISLFPMSNKEYKLDLDTNFEISNNTKNKWLTEIELLFKYYKQHIDLEKTEYTLSLMGYELLLEDDFDEIRERLRLKLNKNNLKDIIPYVSMLGNAYCTYN